MVPFHQHDSLSQVEDVELNPGDDLRSSSFFHYNLTGPPRSRGCTELPVEASDPCSGPIKGNAHTIFPNINSSASQATHFYFMK